jgi:hypothetical protein
MASKKKRKSEDAGDDERPEARAFFDAVHEIKATVAKEAARDAAQTLGRPEDELRPYFFDAIHQAFFRLFATVDRVGGPDDFPSVELTLEDGESLNASFLHDLYIEYEPEEEAQGRQRPRSKPIVMDPEQSVGLLKALSNTPGLDVHAHDTYFTVVTPEKEKPKRKRRKN